MSNFRFFCVQKNRATTPLAGAGRTSVRPSGTPGQNLRARNFTEVDIVISKTKYKNNELFIGEAPNNALVFATNLTWLIAHELGHFLGLQDQVPGMLQDSTLSAYTWKTAIMFTSSRDNAKRWIETIPEREQRLLKLHYGVKQLFAQRR